MQHDDASDNEAMIDHCAGELIDAFETKDKTKAREALHVLIADLMMKMQPQGDD